jgi:hypothetical protein
VLSLPPKMPGNDADFERAIMLLGSRAKTELQNKARAELVELLGSYPSAGTAAEWKLVLSTFRKEGQEGLDRLNAQKRRAEQNRTEKARKYTRPPVPKRGIRSFHAQQADQERLDRIKRRFRVRGSPPDGSDD